MNISDESLKLLNIVMTANPKHSPKEHPCDYNRWLEFVISTYKNEDYIKPWELYNYLIENGFENFTEEAEDLVKHCMLILDFINHMDRFKYSAASPNCKWLAQKLYSE